MVFNSVIFLALLIITVFLFYISKKKYQWMFLLVASLIFYIAWSPILIFLMIFLIGVNFITSNSFSTAKNKKLNLIICICINFGVLFIFKYFNFFNSTINQIFNLVNIKINIPKFDILLPMGISFYTFQVVGYTIDVYRKDIKPQKNFFKLMLFISFFPQLVAGPIERSNNLMSQLFKSHKLNFQNFIIGFKYMIFGYFKKVVIADRVSVFVNNVYNDTVNFSGIYFVIATIFFAFQIYCDFSGYSDIAKGTARLFDINLMDNFKTPYMATSIRDFWRRWHISLSTWFKDYLYIPLGGNKKHKYFNTLITFLVSGLWHGASLTYVIWGLIHGVLQIFEDLASKIFKFNNIIINFFKRIIVFIIVCFTWIFFRANSIKDSIYIIKNILADDYKQNIISVLNNLGPNLLEVFIAIVMILLLIIIEFISKDENIHVILARKNIVINFVFYYIITMLVFGFGVYYDSGAFIYFQF